MIRSATINDAKRILEIYGPCIVNTAISFESEVPSIQEMQNRIAGITAKLPWLVYEQDGVIAGYAYADTYRSRVAYAWSAESTVYVDPNFFRRGIAKKLYQTLLPMLKDQGFANVFAGIALPNDASVGIHESIGFKQIGQFHDVGFKHGKWWDVGWWQLQLQKPDAPKELLPPKVLE